MNILVTGGAGYIGSHTVLELLNSGFDVVVVDNLCNSSSESLRRIEAITGKTVKAYEADLRDEKALNSLFATEKIDAVIHFAGLKAVGESVQDPLRYYDNNLMTTIVLCRAMAAHGIFQLVFSSSATVYGLQATPKYTESMSKQPVNPYGRTKAMAEDILEDLCHTSDPWRITALRYFNPIGAHPSGRIGEDPSETPNNLFPFIMQVAVGRRPYLSIFGDDYDTEDGTGIRDYIHVVDLALGHVAALNNPPQANTFETYNLGSGTGCSVLEVVRSVERAVGKPIPYKIQPRRDGDLAIYFADPSKANAKLNWRVTKSLDSACEDGWKWQLNNPQGYNIKQVGDL